jgi:hypothetical protein
MLSWGFIYRGKIQSSCQKTIKCIEQEFSEITGWQRAMCKDAIVSRYGRTRCVQNWDSMGKKQKQNKVKTGTTLG